jgi:hypothetical protein
MKAEGTGDGVGGSQEIAGWREWGEGRLRECGDGGMAGRRDVAGGLRPALRR